MLEFFRLRILIYITYVAIEIFFSNFLLWKSKCLIKILGKEIGNENEKTPLERIATNYVIMHKKQMYLKKIRF